MTKEINRKGNRKVLFYVAMKLCEVFVVRPPRQVARLKCTFATDQTGSTTYEPEQFFDNTINNLSNTSGRTAPISSNMVATTSSNEDVCVFA